MGLVDGGSARALFADHEFTLQAGDVVVIGPGIVHSCNPLPGDQWSYRMFYFDWAWVEQVAPVLARRLVASVAHRPLRDVAAVRAVETFTAAIRLPNAPRDPEAGVTRALRLILRKVQPVTKLSPKVGPNRAVIAAVQELLARQSHRKQSLRALARELGQDQYQLIRRFRSQLGLTPHAYKLDQQVIEARKLLADGSDIAEVAHALGFADQSHFQRTFKSRTAATPAQYQGGRKPSRRRKKRVTGPAAGMAA